MTRVTVTGAAGLLGRAVVRELVGAGYDVAAIDRRAPADADARAALAGAKVHELDLFRRARLDRALEGSAAVVHLAAFPSPLGRAPETVFRNNTGATFVVLEAAARAGARTAILASSTSALGMTYAPQPFSPDYVPIDEEHRALPVDPYALSKLVDEQTGAMMHRRTGMTVLAFRFHWITSLAEAADAARATATDPGRYASELWGYVDSRDAAAACRLGLESSGLGFEVLNIAASDSLASDGTAALVRRFHPTTRVGKELSGSASAWSTRRARAIIGFEPRYSWREAA